MTIERPHAPSQAVCTRCAGSVRPGTRFCVLCGAPVAPGTGPAGFAAAPFVPAPRTPPQSGPFGAPVHAAPPPMRDPAAQRARTARIAVVVGALLVVVAAVVVGTVVVVTGRAPATQAATTAPPSSSDGGAGGGAAVGASADPTAQLQAQQQADNAAAESAVGAWMPELSAKRVGLVADGTRYDAAAILADHQRLRAQYPGTLLVWSGDYASFKGSDFWVTLAGQSFATPEAANAWCSSAGFDADHCYAKRLSHTGGYTGNTQLRR